MTESRMYWIKKSVDQKVADRIMKLEEDFEKQMLKTECKDYEIHFEEHIRKIEVILLERKELIDQWQKKIQAGECLDKARILEN